MSPIARRNQQSTNKLLRSVSRWPDITNTGPDVAGYTSRTAYTGSMSVAGNTTITGKNITGVLVINGPNVTIQGCKITGAIQFNAVDMSSSHVLDCDIDAGRNTDYTINTNSCTGGLDVRRNNMYNTASDGLQLSTGAHQIIGNWIHDIIPTPGAHLDMIQWWDGLTPVGAITRIINNTITHNGTADTTASLSLSANSPTDYYHDYIVDNNLLGGCTFVAQVMYNGGSSPRPSNNLTFTNNQFWTSSAFAYGGLFYTPSAPYQLAVWGTSPNNNVWRGNVWHDGPSQGKYIYPNETTNSTDFM